MIAFLSMFLPIKKDLFRSLIFCLILGGLAGWLSGIEPELKVPQTCVLPLHHSHHKKDKSFSTPGGNRTPIASLEGWCSIR